jgi:hypothetical protein
LDHSFWSPFERGYSFGAIGNFGHGGGDFGWRLDGFIGRRRDCWVEEQRGGQGVFGKRVEQKGAFVLDPTPYTTVLKFIFFLFRFLLGFLSQ